MKGIAFAGSMIVDHIKTVRAFPEDGDLCPIVGCTDSVGGLVCNTGIDLAVLDPTVPISAVGCVGKDSDGDMVLEALKKRNIDTSCIKRIGRTSFSDVFSCEKQRTIFQYGGACDEFDLTEKEIGELDCRILHIGYLLLLKKLDGKDRVYGTKMARLLHAVKERGIMTSVDMVSENGNRYKKVLAPALKYTDILVCNELEAEKTTGVVLRKDGRLLAENMEKALICLKDMGVSKWAVIHAPEGAYGIDEKGSFAYLPSAPLPEGYIGGKVGAGDAFCAGVLLAAYKELTLEKALAYGNASAQVSLRSPTATGSMTGIEEALDEYTGFLKL